MIVIVEHMDKQNPDGRYMKDVITNAKAAESFLGQVNMSNKNKGKGEAQAGDVIGNLRIVKISEKNKA